MENLTEIDLLALEQYRLERYRKKFPELLANCHIVLTWDGMIYLISHVKNTQSLVEANVELRWQAYLIFGATWLVIADLKEEIYENATRPHSVNVCNLDESAEWHKLENILGATTPMTTTTVLEPIVSQIATTPVESSSDLNLPTLEDVAPLAAKLGLSVEFVATQIKNLNGTIARIAQTYVTTEPSWIDFCVWYRAEIDRQLGVSTTVADVAPDNGAVSTPSTSEPMVQTAKRYRFKKSDKGATIERSLASFMTAQGWDEAKRAEMIEAIAALPKESVEPDSLVEQVALKLGLLYDSKNPSALRSKLVNTAKRLMGKAA